VKDTELYAQILGIGTPFSVTRVELQTAKGNVSIWVEHEPGARFACPGCEASCSVYDHAEERTWRHLDTCQLQTLLHARAAGELLGARCPSGPRAVGGAEVAVHAAV